MSNALVLRRNLDVAEYRPSDHYDGDFHLQFRDPPMTAGGFEEADVDYFLRRVFAGNSPLECKRLQLRKINGKLVALVRFRRSEFARRSNISRLDAGTQLCTLLFDSKSRSWLRLVTSESLLGISAVSRKWKDWFNRALFTASLNQGPPLLEEIATEFNHNHLPTWALVLAFAVVAGFNIGAFADPTSFSPTAFAQLFGVAAVRHSKQILESFSVRQNNRITRRELEEDWQHNHHVYTSSMDATLRALAKYTGAAAYSPNRDSLSPSGQLCEALYNMAESAAKLVTSNQKLLQAFMEACSEAERDRLLAKAGATLSFSVATYAAVAMEEAAVASAAVAETTIAGPVILTAASVIGGVYCVVKAKKKVRKIKAFNSRILYHESLRSFLLQSWQLAADAERFLEWMHCAGSDRAVLDGLDDGTRHEWRQFLDTFLKQLPPHAARDPAMLAECTRAYLALRYQDLQCLSDQVEEAEEEAFAIGKGKGKGKKLLQF